MNDLKNDPATQVALLLSEIHRITGDLALPLFELQGGHPCDMYSHHLQTLTATAQALSEIAVMYEGTETPVDKTGAGSQRKQRIAWEKRRLRGCRPLTDLEMKHIADTIAQEAEKSE